MIDILVFFIVKPFDPQHSERLRIPADHLQNEVDEVGMRALLKVHRECLQVVKTFRLLDIGQAECNHMPTKPCIRRATTGRI